VEVDHPLERVARWRYVIIAVVSLTAGIVSGGRGDGNEFVHAGRGMFGSAGLSVGFRVAGAHGRVLTAFTWAKLGGYGHLDGAMTLGGRPARGSQGRPISAALATGLGIACKPWE
jgi:hypothetical protein